MFEFKLKIHLSTNQGCLEFIWSLNQILYLNDACLRILAVNEESYDPGHDIKIIPLGEYIPHKFTMLVTCPQAQQPATKLAAMDHNQSVVLK